MAEKVGARHFLHLISSFGSIKSRKHSIVKALRLDEKKSLSGEIRFYAEFEQKLLANVIDAAVQEAAQFEEKLRCSSPVADFTYDVCCEQGGSAIIPFLDQKLISRP